MASEIVATFPDLDGSRIEARTASGHELGVDAEANAAVAPKEALLAALAGCTSVDVISILRKKRQSVTRYELALRGESASEHPRVFTRVVVEHRVEGDVEPEALRRSIELSATRYCPVSAMLSASVVMEHRYRLRQTGQPERSERVVVTGPSAADAG